MQGIFYTFLPAIPNNPKSLAFSCEHTPWGNPVREHYKKINLLNWNLSNTFYPEGNPLFWTFTDLMTHCPVVICWSYCQEGSKCSRKDRTSLSLLLKSVYSRKWTFALSKNTHSEIHLTPGKKQKSLRFHPNRKPGYCHQAGNQSFHTSYSVYNDESFLCVCQIYRGPKT